MLAPVPPDDGLIGVEKVFAPAKVCAPVFTSPCALAEASGRLKVCVLLELEMLKLLPDVPVAKVCEPCVRPFSEVMPPVPPPAKGNAVGDAVGAASIFVIENGPANTVAMGVPKGLKPFVLAAGAQLAGVSR